MELSPAGDTAQPAARLWLTQVVGSRIVDRAGERLGRINDVIVRLAEGGYPPVSGLVGRIAGRRLFVPLNRIGDLTAEGVQLTGEMLSLARFERRQGEVLLREDVLGRSVISVDSGRLVTANDIELARGGDAWRVVGVEPGRGSFLRRLLPRLLRSRPRETRGFVDWANVEPFVGHVPTSRLLLPLRRLRRLHPAQIADIVEHASHEEGEEIISAVHGDPELEADVFEELNTEHQVEFLRSRSDSEAASVLAGMGPDDAADLITELDRPRRAPILELLPAAQQAKVRALLSYNPESAGGLMSPDFVAARADASAAQALAAVRAAHIGIQAAATVFITDSEGRLTGGIPLVTLVRHEDASDLSELVE